MSLPPSPVSCFPLLLPPSDPISLAEQWGMSRSLWTQEWSTLSGGQVQHLHLAIALTSGADVLLLGITLFPPPPPPPTCSLPSSP